MEKNKIKSLLIEARAGIGALALASREELLTGGGGESVLTAEHRSENCLRAGGDENYRVAGGDFTLV